MMGVQREARDRHERALAARARRDGWTIVEPDDPRAKHAMWFVNPGHHGPFKSWWEANVNMIGRHQVDLLTRTRAYATMRPALLDQYLERVFRGGWSVSEAVTGMKRHAQTLAAIRGSSDDELPTARTPWSKITGRGPDPTSFADDVKRAVVKRDGRVILDGVVIGTVTKTVTKSAMAKGGAFGYYGRPTSIHWYPKRPDGTPVGSVTSAISQKRAVAALVREHRRARVGGTVMKKVLKDARPRAGSRRKPGAAIGGGTSKWGRPGTAAELYRRLIMETTLSNAGVYAVVIKQLGEAAAGKPSYAAWYRNQLVKQGHKPRASA